MSDILVITGASRGIGLATAQHFLQQGWQVINISRQACSLAGVTNLQIDLGEAGWQQKHETAISSLLKSANRICLTHNAGVLFKDNIVDLPEQNLRTSLEINLMAPMLLNQILLPLMQPGSAILYIGSTLSELAAPNTASYTISKHAILGLMRATAQDLFGRGITTTCICPGFTETEMVKDHLGQDAKILQTLASKLTLGRLCTPEEMAEVIYFCATHPVMNGATLHANQGGPRT